MEIGAFVYDLDETLVDSGKYIQKMYGKICKSAGVKPTTDILESGSSWRRLLKKLHISHRTAEDLYRQNILKIKLCGDEIRDMLRDVHSSGCRQGVCTNSPRSLAEPILESNGVSDYVDCMVTYDDLKKLGLKPKPAPDSLLWLAEELKVEPGRCLYVGDTSEDILAGKRAGMITVAVAYKGGCKKFKKLKEISPDLGVMTSTSQLYNLVKLLI